MAQIPNGAKRHQYKTVRPKDESQGKAAHGASGSAAPLKTKGDYKRAQKERMGKIAKYVLVGIGVAAMVLSVSTMACAGVLNQVQSGEEYHLTGGVAAEVNGTNITEDTVTRQIMSTRSSYGYDDDAEWAAYLYAQGLTPETYRENIIDSYARQLLIQDAEQEMNITVSDEEVDEAWQDAIASAESEDAFISQLETYGLDEETYRESLRSSLAQDKLREQVAQVDDPTDEDIVAYVNENLSTYNDARRSSHILIKVDSDADDETRAEAQAKLQEAIDKINAGEMTFADAAKEYSEDTSAEDGGDVGWDKLTSFVTEYQDALSALQPGQMSGIVETTYGYHVIQCTELFHVDGEVTSIDQIPEDLRTQVSDTIRSNEEETAYNDWYTEYEENADYTVNPMPEDVPYNVDMSLASEGDEKLSGIDTSEPATSEDAADEDAAAEDAAGEE